jgi:phage-related protein
MREIIFYRTASGRCPVEEFLDTLSDRQVEKILWVLRLVKSLDPVPKQYFKLLPNTEGIWEVRVQLGNDIFRLLGFWAGSQLIVLTHGFAKKTQKVPRKEIIVAQQRRKDHLERSK